MPNYRSPGVIDLAAERTTRLRGTGVAGTEPMVSPYPARQNDPTPDELERGLINEVGLDLLQLALDLAGIADPTPTADGASALISMARGQWLDAVLSGVSMVPYIGDLAKAGKLPKYLRTLEKAITLAEKSKEAAKMLLPALVNLQKVLRLFPEGSPETIKRMQALVDRFLSKRAVLAATKVLPDIGNHFRFSTRAGPSGNLHRIAEGRLGVPGKVKVHRKPSAQAGVSSGMGDDAGHLIGNRFGAPGDARNLSLQNWKSNRGGGSFYDLEERWAQKLEAGIGIEVKVTDMIKKGDSSGRPFGREVEWTEILADGSRTKGRQTFMNMHSPKSRKAQDIPLKVDAPQKGNVIPTDFVNKKIIR